MLGSDTFYLPSDTGDSGKELWGEVMGMDDIVVLYQATEFDDVTKIVKRPFHRETIDLTAGRSEPFFQWCLFAIEQHYVYVMTLLTHDGDHVNNEGFGTSGKERGYYVKDFHLFTFNKRFFLTLCLMK